MIFNTISTSNAYSASLLPSSEAHLYLYLSTYWLHSCIFHFTSSSAAVMSVGSGIFGSSMCFNRQPMSFPKSLLMVIRFWTFSDKSAYSFFVVSFFLGLQSLEVPHYDCSCSHRVCVCRCTFDAHISA